MDISAERWRNRELLSGFPGDSMFIEPVGVTPGPGGLSERPGGQAVSQNPSDVWRRAACVEMSLRFF